MNDSVFEKKNTFFFLRNVNSAFFVIGLYQKMI